MPHMIGYVSKSKINYRNGLEYFLNFGTVRMAKLKLDVYTNDRNHRVCFLTMLSMVLLSSFFLKLVGCVEA